MNINKIDFKKIIEKIDEPYRPETIAVLNDRVWVELSLHKGPFPLGMHHHEKDDELFICLEGEVSIQFPDTCTTLEKGQAIHIKAGQKHCPIATNNCFLIRIKSVPHMEATLEDGRIISRKTLEDLNK